MAPEIKLPVLPTEVRVASSGVFFYAFGVKSGLGPHEIRAEATRDWMAHYASQRKVCGVFGINGHRFNAQVVEAIPRNFPQVSYYPDGVGIFTGVEADGVFGIKPGMGFVIRSADCPLVFLAGNDERVFLHAGFNSIHPHPRGEERRDGVIEHGLDTMKTPPSEIRAYVLYGVGPTSFPCPDDHPKHGQGNRELREFVARVWGRRCVRVRRSDKQPSISLPHIITAQLLRRGVLRKHITWDDIDTVTDRKDGEFVYHSSTRSRERNLILALCQE